LQAQLLQRPPTATGGMATGHHGGLFVGGAAQASTKGGLGSAMAQAASQAPPPPVPTVAPRLDSFKMIKVIGKGSFGE
jgi:hypothetical protein